MALTSAVANAAAAAAAAGAGKKAAQVQLQAELNSDDDWNKFLLRDGLLVVDVYTEWCGPCLGMVGNLKKIKVELGGDNLHLAVAKSDTIECLQRFRKRSEPTWMFIASGQLVNVVFGADAPRLTRTIEQELRNEELVRKGELERPHRAPHELTPPEQEMADAEAKLQEERRQRSAAAQAAAREARREARARRLEAHFADLCPALMLPHAQKYLRKLSDSLDQNGLVVSDKCPLLVGRQGARRLAAEEPALAAAPALAALAERPALALLLRKAPDTDGDLIELCRRSLCGDGLDEEARQKNLYEELKVDSMPGLFVPADRHQRAAALDLLFPKMVGAVVEPPAPPEPPHVAVVVGAWQRRAALAALAGPLAARLLRLGFFADADLQQPRLLAKTVDQYDERAEKDYGETMVLMLSVGEAEPELCEAAELSAAAGRQLQQLPAALAALGPRHVSTDAVAGAAECARFFPPGYNEPGPKPKARARKKRKKRQEKEETVESMEAPPQAEAEVEGEADGEDSHEHSPDDEDTLARDKATSPPPA